MDFLEGYRALVRAYSLSPELSERQLAAILRRLQSLTVRPRSSAAKDRKERRQL